MSQHAPSSNDPLVGEVRFRIPLPILVPVGAFLLIAAVTIGFSRILLNVPAEAATAVAVATAANVLIACAVVALRPSLTQTSIAEMAVILIYPIIIGVLIAQLGIGADDHAAGRGDHPAPAPAAGPVEAGGSMGADDFEFSSAEIHLTAGEEASITLDNQDSTPHNIKVFEGTDPSGEMVFDGQDVAGGSSTTYSIPALEAGEYYFHCSIHPAMEGTVAVE